MRSDDNDLEDQEVDIPTKDDDLDDFDDDDWNANKKGPNPAMRQVNAMRPQTSGKPGQRGFHGIGGRKPQPAAATGNADDLDDMLDGFSGGNDPLAIIN